MPTHLLHFAWIATPGIYAQSSENQRWLSASRHLLAAFGRCGGVRAVMAGSCAEYDWSQVAVCDERSSPLAHGETCESLRGIQDRTATRARVVRARARAILGLGADILPVRTRGASRPPGRLGDREPARRARSAVHARPAGPQFPACRGRRRGLRRPARKRGAGTGQHRLGRAALDRASFSGGSPAGSAARNCSSSVRAARRSAEPAVLVPDVGRLRDEVRWRPRWSLDAGLEDTVRWWRAGARMIPLPEWHPMAVHFPLALTVTAALVLSAARAKRLERHGATLGLVGTWNLCLGAVGALLALGYRPRRGGQSRSRAGGARSGWRCMCSGPFLRSAALHAVGGVARRGNGCESASLGLFPSAVVGGDRGARGHGLPRRRECVSVRRRRRSRGGA